MRVVLAIISNQTRRKRNGTLKFITFYKFSVTVNRLREEKVKKDYMNQKPDKFEICPVMYVDNTMYINFLGFGITYENKEHVKTPTVKISYSGEIGKPDFKFSVLENVG